MACLAGGTGDTYTKEICYYQSNSVVAQDTKWKVRYIHTVLVEADEYVGRLRWERSQRNVRASLILLKRKKEEGRAKHYSWSFRSRLGGSSLRRLRESGIRQIQTTSVSC